MNAGEHASNPSSKQRLRAMIEWVRLPDATPLASLRADGVV